jgi:hypothetical protein
VVGTPVIFSPRRLDRRFLRLDRRYRRLTKRWVLPDALNCGILPVLTESSLSLGNRVDRWSESASGGGFTGRRKQTMGRSLWNRTAAIAAACVVAGSVTSAASAAIVINIQQVGSDVVADLSGSFNTLTAGSSTNTNLGPNYSIRGGDKSNAANIITFAGSDPSALSAVRFDGTLTSSPSSATAWGTVAGTFKSTTTQTTLTGPSRFWFDWTGGLTPTPRVHFGGAFFNGAVSGSMTFLNETMETLALTNYGSFVYTFGGNQTVTVNLINPTPVVIPGAGLAGLATLGLAGLARRRRR